MVETTVPSPTDALASVRTLAELLTWRVAQTPDASAYLRYDDARQAWAPVSWAEVGRQVAQMAAALDTLNLERGSRVAILLPNGLQSVIVDQAALASACVPVPLHALDNPASIAYIVADSDAAVVVAQTPAQWRAIADVGVPFPTLRQVLLVEEPTAPTPATAGAPRVDTLRDWLAAAPQTTATCSATSRPRCSAWRPRRRTCSCPSCRCPTPSSARPATTCPLRPAAAWRMRARWRSCRKT